MTAPLSSCAFLAGTNKEKLLRLLFERGLEVRAVVLPSKSPREERLAEVKREAEAREIPVLRPKRVALEAELRRLAPDLLVSAGYPFLLNARHLAIPRFAINVHPTLLPAYRGPATTWHVLANGEREGGVTVHFIDLGMDTGPILAQGRFPLGPFDTLRSYMRKAAELEPRLLEVALDRLARGETAGEPQDPARASVFPGFRSAADSRIDPSRPLSELYDFIRACDPDRFPAFFEVEGQKVGIRLFRLERPEGEEETI